MIRYNDFLAKHPNIKQGMDAYTVDGEKLGTVVELGEDSLLIEKGFFFPRDFSFRYDDITDITDSKLILNQNRKDVESWKNDKFEGWSKYDKLSTSEEANIPLREEKLEAEKVVRQKGELRIRKVVHTEMKNITVPVTKEEVIVERTPVNESAAPSTPETTSAFKEEEVKIPIMEEEVKAVKTPIVKEELKIKKKAHIEPEKVSGEVKKEEIKVEKDEENRRKAA